jgi:YEATS family
MADVIENSVPAVSESNDVIAADTASSDHPPATTAAPTTAPHSLSTHLSTRLDRTTVCLPIVHGSVAFYLGKKAENKNEFQSHQWTLYLRGPNNEDLSHCIEKVVFQLHPSFAQPIREYTQPPYEVTEKGWGEFDAQIRIHWKDPSEAMTMVCCVFALSLLLWSDTTKKPMYSLD